GKRRNGQPLTDADKKYLTDYIASIEFAVPEYKQYQSIAPNVAFKDSLVIQLGKREVQIMFLGRGNTPADPVVYVPDAKTVITGDLLVAPTPYSYGSFISDWIETLGKIKGLGATSIIPGHGPVWHDYSYLDQVTAALQFARDGAKAAVAKHLS